MCLTSEGGTLHCGVQFVAPLFPTHMEAVLAPLSRLDIASADPDVVFRTNWTRGLSKFDLAILWHVDLSFLLAFALAFARLVVIVFDHRFCSGRSATGCWLCDRALRRSWHRHNVVLYLCM